MLNLIPQELDVFVRESHYTVVQINGGRNG